MPTELPKQGWPAERVLEMLEAYKKGDIDWRAGRAFSLVYHAGDEHRALLQQAYAAYLSENGLNPMAFKSAHRLEAEVVRMAAKLLRGGDEVVGTMTTGGTESILMAVKAAKHRGAAKKRIRRPNLVLPETAHVAFDKAAEYFGVEARYAKLTADYRVDVGDAARLIDGNTVLLVGSAPQYVQGVVDPIEALARLAAKRRLPLHVDACVGGFVLPFLEDLGEPIPPWDFRVPGVTSISLDVHKYGYAAKGASVILYRSMDFLKHQFFVSTNWGGGVYASPTMTGTRSAGAMAAAWASLTALGESGLRRHAERALKAKRQLVRAVEGDPRLEVVGAPDATLVCFRGREGSGVDTFALADALEKRGWHCDRHQKPPSIHCTVMSQHADTIGDFTADLALAADEVAAHPEAAQEGSAALYGMMAKVPFRGLVRQSVQKIMEAMYSAKAVEGFDPLAPTGQENWVDRLVQTQGPRLDRWLGTWTRWRGKLPLRTRRPKQGVRR